MSPESWIERAEAVLAQAGRKRGGARRTLLELLAAQTCALTAAEIEAALQEAAGRRVSRASIYRIIDELEELGLVQRVEVGQAMARYERAGAGAGHHHHLLCARCGLLTPFYDAKLEGAIRRLSAEVPLKVHEHEIVLRGECRDCAGAARSPGTFS
jgi:Fur family transcriptional regulator, ferric uptake regulator